MNKKFLFAAMSLAALTACSTDDLGSQSQTTAEGTSPIQFEVLNNDDVTRASMNTTEHKVVFSASDGDLFTLYHGATTLGTTAFENATYKAGTDASGKAVLSTPSMIKQGYAIMTWPVDTLFTNTGAGINISIPAVQTNLENNLPYVSDVINIGAIGTPSTAAYNTAGYNRSYPVYMRPMASQLIVKTDYNGTDAALTPLYEGATGVATGEGIAPISVTSIVLQANNKKFTTVMPLAFTAVSSGDTDDARWDAAVPNNAWSHKTGFGTTYTTQSATLTAKDKCLLAGNQGCTFLILPQANIADGSEDATSAVIVNTNYGKVIIGDPTAGASGSAYTATEAADAWYRYISNPASATTDETAATAAETSGDNVGKYKTTSEVKMGMKQTLNVFSAFTAPTGTGIVDGEAMGTWTTRYVKVLLNHIDMDGLHVTSDKQLYDAVRVWKAMGLDNATHNITVKLDGDATTGEFVISQKTIKAINDLNAAAAEEETARSFSVQPCTDSGEACTTIVVTGGGEIAADLTFIKANGTTKADMVLNAGENWEWPASTTAVKKITVDATATGVNSIINKGTLTSNATAKLAVYDNAATTPVQLNIPFVNDVTGIWNITAGDLTVQFNVTNNGTVNITSGAEYHQDIVGTTATTFTNQALTVPDRFYQKDPTKTAEQKAAFVEQIGKVNNSGVFAVTGTSTVKGVINNYGRIEHMLATAKTYITSNQLGSTTPNFATAFNDAATSGSGTDNKFGLINLPYAIRSSANNVSVSSALNQGFISLTYTGATNTETLSGNFGNKVNYVIVESGISTIGELDSNIKYLEINESGTEIVFTKSTSSSKNKFEGLMVLSNVNIQQGITLTVSKATFLAAKMYVGGTFNQGSWDGYYGNTTTNYTSNYITY